MRVFVSGSAGFIGTHLTQELQSAGHEVVGHDRENGDLTKPGVFFGSLTAAEPVDHVVHLAAQVGRLFGEQDLEHTLRSNAEMTMRVANVCGQKNIPLLYTSTSEVYGDRGAAACMEYGPQKLPHNLYGLSKRFGEELCLLYAPDNLKIVRLSMPYGPGAPPGRGRRAMDTFLWQAHHRMPITVHRGAERSWCHVLDTVKGIRLVMEQGDGPYNVGRDDVPVSMLKLARMCCKLTGGSESLIRVVDPPSAQTVVKRLSTTRLHRLGWEPHIDLEDGLKELLLWVTQFPKLNPNENFTQELVDEVSNKWWSEAHGKVVLR